MEPVDVGQDLSVVHLRINPGGDCSEDEDEQEVKPEECQFRSRPRAVEVEEEASVGDDREGEEVGGELLRVNVRGQGGPPGEVERVESRRRGEEEAAGAKRPYPQRRRGELLPLPRPIEPR